MVHGEVFCIVHFGKESPVPAAVKSCNRNDSDMFGTESLGNLTSFKREEHVKPVRL